MMRPIDADALACAKLDFSKIYIAGRRSRKGLELARFCAKVVLREMIASAPTIEAEPVRHGRWGRCGGDLHSSGYAIYCSVCNKNHFVHYKYSLGGLYGCKELFERPKYCPSCGAIMEEGNDL